jgi:hypothetical protein
MSALVVIGSLVFVPTYGLALSAGVGALAAGSSYAGCPSNRWLVVPIAGPFVAQTGLRSRVQLGTDAAENGRQFACQDSEGLGSYVLGFDGVLQILGFALMASGLNSPPQVLVRDHDPIHEPSSSSPGETIHWRLVPWHLGTSSAGVGLVGTF